MKFFFFHLMPYAALDLDYDKTYDSAWVTLPNSYYDPKIGHQLYNRYLDELEYADEVGFDGVCVNEHHQNAYGLMPIPGVMAGALARRTKNVKIAVLGRALPLLNNPLGGGGIRHARQHHGRAADRRLRARHRRRISFGGANPAESHERFQEAHDLIIQAWTRTGPFPFEGKYYHLEYVNTWPRCYQQPHPPIWIPSQGSRETIEWASHPRASTRICRPTARWRSRATWRCTASVPRNTAGTATSEQVGWSIPAYAAETDAIAYREAKPHIETFLNKFLRMPPEMLLPPGYLSLTSMMGVMQAKAAIGGKQTIDEVIERGMFLCGSAATLREKIEKYQKEIGFGYLLPMMQFGTLPHELTKKSTEIFAKEVIPYFRARPDVIPARAELARQGA